MKYYWIETYGCQMNTAESNAIIVDLKKNGWKPAISEMDADFVLLNTCSVRKTAENRIWGRIGYYKHLKETKDFTLAVTGCMAERLKGNLKKQAPAVDMVIGNFEKENLSEYLDNNEIWNDNLVSEGEYTFREIHLEENNFKSMVPIMHGCNNFCTYCIVPYVRGREVSRSPQSIIKELKELEKKGVKEVTLLGQNVNSYTYTVNGNHMDFAYLLKLILKETKAIGWIRFMSSHPKDVSDDLIKLISENERLCSHVHLAVQHGSDAVLKRMNRSYTRSKFITLADKMKAAIPNVSITTDLLIGFPGETLEDLEMTKTLMKQVRFNDAFTYYYNPREGTKAFEFTDGIEKKEKLKRLNEIIELQRKISHELKTERVGQIVKILVESVSRKNSEELLSRTEKNEMVVFKGEKSLIGTFRNIKLLSLNGNTFVGELL
ncbi:MAG: tRNA (N6-isopentenyl adenosine(37)-C2)-methylthiotransferase MiaB [Spirochaetaceae bacterium]|nr:tRNA (N6-isopentenyl adenosine(37)-C2)-methylthiotransferase MiaB [Spirochaetaceae bacterium]